MSFPNTELRFAPNHTEEGYPYGPAFYQSPCYVTLPHNPTMIYEGIPSTYVPSYQTMSQQATSLWPITNPPTYYVDTYGRVYAYANAQSQQQQLPPPIQFVTMGIVTYHNYIVKSLVGPVNQQYYDAVQHQQQYQQEHINSMQQEPNRVFTIEDITNVEENNSEIDVAVHKKRSPKKPNKTKRKTKTTAARNSSRVYRSEEGYLVEEPQETEDEIEHEATK